MYEGYGYWTENDSELLIIALLVLVPLFLIGPIIQRHKETAKAIVTLFIIIALIYDFFKK
ncbi:hypothetical protein [Neobacillus sp. PS3-40]|uniref:hypothetical protein n=1 Tax=Neobacillus sp. PS3-40 TaxID=3070679 RepID=UPI0027E13A24|nr:hypothetical protein [Neobacillus sp. PS3-40]WML45401.1 hypothetical protein RCG20_05725 [Neobacillus sp. PS3-40]